MIKGLGIDLIEVERIKKALRKDRFLKRYFTENECRFFMEHKNNPLKIAGNFAVKEAVVKVIGTGFGKIHPVNIEVLRETNGKPYVQLYEEALEASKKLGIKRFHISISNTKEYATAVAVGEGDE